MALERPVAATVDDPELLKRWLYNLWVQVTAPSSGINETNHAALGNLNSLSYTHLTAAQATSLTTGNNSTIHYHASDRDRANHTGTQSVSTINDLNSASVNNVGVTHMAAMSALMSYKYYGAY